MTSARLVKVSSEPRTPHRARVALVSTYPPRQCGIATFTRDLRGALTAAAPDLDFVVCAIDRDAMEYGSEVEFVVRQDSYEDYAKAAAEMADSGVSAVVIQHEYGIFGGPDGVWITSFAEVLRDRAIPYLVTLHTLLAEPSPEQASTLRRLCADAFAVSVFTETARRLAVETGVAPAPRITVVPHGAPAVLYADPRALLADPRAAREIRPEVTTLLAESHDRRIVSTFGLVSPGKGLESAIKAVVAAATEYPDIRYVIAGATHPEVAKRQGEGYHRQLVDLVAELGAEEHVCFLDFFLSDVEIAVLLKRTEVFLTPYRSRDQTSSGALTFALAAGCPVVSTDYPYARDMLAGGAGTVVRHDDPERFGQALCAMLADPARRTAAAEAARALGATLSWPWVGLRVAGILHRAITGDRTNATPARPKVLISQRFPKTGIVPLTAIATQP